MIAAALLVLLASAWGPGVARAAGASTPGMAPPEVDDYLADLDSADAARRRLAARTLRAMVKSEVRRSSRRGGDDIVQAEALMTLQDFDQRLAPRCLQYLEDDELTVACADILLLLETTEALPRLHQVLQVEDRRRARRRLQRTITRLEQYAAEGP